MRRLIDANALIEKLNARKDLFISMWSRNLEISPEDKARVDELGMCIAEVFNAPHRGCRGSGSGKVE